MWYVIAWIVLKNCGVNDDAHVMVIPTPNVQDIGHKLVHSDYWMDWALLCKSDPCLHEASHTWNYKMCLNQKECQICKTVSWEKPGRNLKICKLSWILVILSYPGSYCRPLVGFQEMKEPSRTFRNTWEQMIQNESRRYKMRTDTSSLSIVL